MSLSANELRIGNWVISYYPIAQEHKEYRIKKGSDIDSSEDEDYGYYPIPLTPEILEKAGFEFITDWTTNPKMDGICYYKNLGYLQFATSMMGLAVTLLDKESVSTGVNVQYVHQLQNLYFALTQTELNIEL